MTLATAIVFIETLFVFQSPPVALTSDFVGGVYAATQTEIFHFSNDSILESTSRASSEMLSGITDMEFSGSWLYVLLGERNIVEKFDRRLNYLGAIELMLRSDNLAVTPDGDIWLYDEFSQRMAKYSSVGDPAEIVRSTGRSAYFENAVLIGFANWTDLINCLPIRGTAPRSISSIDVPILWMQPDRVIVPGFEHDAKIELSPTVRQLWISNGNIAYAAGDSIYVCDYGTFDWTAFKKLPQNIVITDFGLYAIVKNSLIKVGVKWRR